MSGAGLCCNRRQLFMHLITEVHSALAGLQLSHEWEGTGNSKTSGPDVKTTVVVVFISTGSKAGSQLTASLYGDGGPHSSKCHSIESVCYLQTLFYEICCVSSSLIRWKWSVQCELLWDQLHCPPSSLCVPVDVTEYHQRTCCALLLLCPSTQSLHTHTDTPPLCLLHTQQPPPPPAAWNLNPILPFSFSHIFCTQSAFTYWFCSSHRNCRLMI